MYGLRRGLFILTLILASLTVAGCGSPSDNVVHVQGTATFNGKPIPLGMIIFEPDHTKGGKGPQGYAEIRDGKFDTRGPNGKGAAPGGQILHITGGDGVNAEAFTPLGNVLFDEYTTKIEVSKDQQPLTIDVPRAKKK